MTERSSRTFSLLAEPLALSAHAFSQVCAVWPRLLELIEERGPEAFVFLLGEEKDQKPESFALRGSTAVIPVHGPLFEQSDFFSRLFGDSSYSGIRQLLAEALASPRVRSIVLDVDSPGGSALGHRAVSDAVFSARSVKPTRAVIRGEGASAAYDIAAAAEEVIVGHDSIAGSIGVRFSYRDWSEADAKRGVRTIELLATQSPRKRLDPTTDVGRAQAQQLIDQLAEQFIASVARGRGVSEQTVVRDFGAGGVLVGRHAVEAGLADRIGTLDQVLGELEAGEAA